MIRRIKKWIPRRVFNFYHWIRGVVAVVLAGYPAKDLVVVGITGTDGKTTTSHMLYSIMKTASRRPGKPDRNTSFSRLLRTDWPSTA